MELTDWLVLFLLTLLAIGCLLFAAGATGPASTIGVVIAAGAVAGILVRIKQYFDRADASHH